MLRPLLTITNMCGTPTTNQGYKESVSLSSSRADCSCVIFRRSGQEIWWADNGGGETQIGWEGETGQTWAGKKLFFFSQWFAMTQDNLFRDTKCKRFLEQILFWRKKKLSRSFRYNWLLGRFRYSELRYYIQHTLMHLNVFEALHFLENHNAVGIGGESTPRRGKAI